MNLKKLLAAATAGQAAKLLHSCGGGQAVTGTLGVISIPGDSKNS